ncbi:8006_t:CDS:1 [Ambispora gerdemannii]|uniref:8006_t:CDS:1 n=1 Tax=Ambispora gerdemannii TaxID=144530 RepID=A0A9N9D0I5_9GLOM|nr:8006_t:CDS:1 [Ambispora gerdemannii]
MTKKIKTKNLPKIEIEMPYPDISPINLLDRALMKTQKTGKTARVPNAFIAYRTVFCRELQKIAHPVITQPQLSLIAKDYWLKEPENVRREYERIAAEAKNLYTQICFDQKLIQQIEEDQDKKKEGSYSFWSKQHSEFAHDPNSWQISQQNTSNYSQTNKEIEVSENKLEENFVSFPTYDFIDNTIFNPQSENNQFSDTAFDFLPVFSNSTLLSSTPPSIKTSLPEPCDSCKKHTDTLEKRVSDLEERINALTETIHLHVYSL